MNAPAAPRAVIADDERLMREQLRARLGEAWPELQIVAEAANGNVWFQVYVWRDREVTRRLVERAAAAGAKAMFLTVDVQVVSQRERDLRNA